MRFIISFLFFVALIAVIWFIVKHVSAFYRARMRNRSERRKQELEIESKRLDLEIEKEKNRKTKNFFDK